MIQSRLTEQENKTCKAIFQNYKKNKKGELVKKFDCNDCGLLIPTKKEQGCKEFCEEKDIKCMGYYFSSPVSNEIREIYGIRKYLGDIFSKSNIIKEIIYCCDSYSRS